MWPGFAVTGGVDFTVNWQRDGAYQGDWPPKQIIRIGLVQVMNQTHMNFSTLESFPLASMSCPGDPGLMQRQKKFLKTVKIHGEWLRPQVKAMQ